MSQQLESSRNQSDEEDAKFPNIEPTSSTIIGSSVTRQQMYPDDLDGMPRGLTERQKEMTDVAIVCPSIKDIAREFDRLR